MVAEKHYSHRTNWLRAAVLGANDGIISVSSLVVGIASAPNTDFQHTFLAGIAGLVAGALSMAAGEYVSVSSQADLEHADLERERKELATEPELELQELTDIYIERGLNKTLAQQVAEQLTAKDALAAHARDELGISHVITAKPFEAAFASALSFSIGAIFPIIAVMIFPDTILVPATYIFVLCLLALLGSLSAIAGGAPITKPALRIVFWGAFAMAATAFIGSMVGNVL